MYGIKYALYNLYLKAYKLYLKAFKIMQRYKNFQGTPIFPLFLLVKYRKYSQKWIKKIFIPILAIWFIDVFKNSLESLRV